MLLTTNDYSTFFGYKVTLLSHSSTCMCIQSYEFNIAALTWSNKQIRQFLQLVVSNSYLFLLTKRNKNLLAMHCLSLRRSAQLQYNFELRRSAAPVTLKNWGFKTLYLKYFVNIIIKQLRREKKKSKECTSKRVSKNNLKSKRIENYGERQIY